MSTQLRNMSLEMVQGLYTQQTPFPSTEALKRHDYNATTTTHNESPCIDARIELRLTASVSFSRMSITTHRYLLLA